jgi:hypothetical protein
VRNSLAVMLVILGALLCFPASLALWEQRTLANEREFVALGQDIIDEEPVQAALARAIGEQIAGFSGVSSVTIRSARIPIDQIALESVRALAGTQAADAALRGVYMTSRRLARIDDQTVQVEGNDLVIDLRETLRNVLDVADDEEPLLQGIALPQNAGRIRITNAKDVALVLDAWRAIDAAAPVLIVLPLVPFVIALIVASGRGFVLFLIGASVAAGAAIRIFLLRGPVDSLLEDLIAGDSVYGDAGFAVYGRIVASYTALDVIVLAGGIVVAVVGLLTSVVMARR